MTELSWGRPHRPARAWAADACTVGAAAALCALFFIAELEDDPSAPGTVPLALQLSLAAAACLALLLRRRWPVAVSLALILAGMISSAAFGAAFVGLFAVATRRPVRVTAIVTGVHLAPIIGLYRFAPITTRQYVETVVTVVLLDATLIASGLLIRSLRERARQAEEGQRLRIEEARRLERERIAREMHDVLAHRISLLAMHAGALEFRPDTPAEEVARAVGVIRGCAFEALEDLREVIGVLRAAPDTAGDDGERPQPTLADLLELVADSRRTGTPVTLDIQLGDLDAVPAGLGRHAYRIVQEGLTNARKHAPGVQVHGIVTGAPGRELTVELRNRLPSGVGVAGIPGAGAGLIGLRERAALVGGRLEHGRTPDGDFRLWTSLPWPG